MVEEEGALQEEDDIVAGRLEEAFRQFGPVKDIYLPRDYYTGDPRGFGFVQYVDPADAAEAKYQMDGQILHGRELTVVFAEENRKKPTEMRARERGGRGRVYDRRQSPPRYSRSRSPVIPCPHLDMEGLILVAVITTLLLRENTQAQKNKKKIAFWGANLVVLPDTEHSVNVWSISPRDRRYSRERSDSRSPVREQSPPYEGPRNRSGRPVRERSPYGSRSRSQSLGRARSPVRARSPSRSRSRSPYPAEYPRETGRDTSPSR
ncbi:hypothetical protein DH2020_000610 [Rehmannia glutinosa]|uniref:RRM domain-containing protein n=1 Tax=Rehmannia glutinosa TaxID=99300 RepID=A0ABR0XX04_REHGL